MKILQIIPALDQGGAEHFVCELAVAIKQRNVKCDVLTLYRVGKGNDLADALRDNGINFYCLNKKNGFDFRVFYKLLKFIRNGGYSVVHVHVGAIKYILLAAFFLKSSNFFATIHSEARREAGRSLDLWSRKILFKNKKCIPVTISEESELSFEEFYGIKGIVIPNGVSPYTKNLELKIRDNREQLVFVHPARCQPVKNQELLFKAFQELVNVYPNVKIIWAGRIDVSKEEYDKLKTIMPSQVEYIGEVKNIRDYLYSADAMCLSSKMEGLPMTILEAFSVGCIPLCTPVGGCKNVIKKGINGFLSDDLTVGSYCRMLKQFVGLSEEERNRIKKEGLETYKEFSIENTCSQYLELFNCNNRKV